MGEVRPTERVDEKVTLTADTRIWRDLAGGPNLRGNNATGDAVTAVGVTTTTTTSQKTGPR